MSKTESASGDAAAKKSPPQNSQAAENGSAADLTPSGSDTCWDDEIMTTKELMAFLKMSRTKVWGLVRSAGLPAFKLGGDYRYRRSEVLVWLERFRTENSAQ